MHRVASGAGCKSRSTPRRRPRTRAPRPVAADAQRSDRARARDTRAALTATDYTLRSATPGDAEAITALVDEAYGHYVARIGRKPGPMTWDYAELIRDWDVTVAEGDGAIIGLLIVGPADEGFVVENLAVHPSRQGEGLGRALLGLAEAKARSAGFDSIYLFTHEKMTENRALYARIGYVEYERRTEAGLSRVFMRKPLR